MDSLFDGNLWVALAFEAHPHHAIASREFACLQSASPKVWMDACLAAFDIAGGLRFVTLDRDFESYEPHGLELELLNL